MKPEKSKFTDNTLYTEEARQYIKDKRSLETTTGALPNVVWGQSSRLIQNKLKSNKNYIEFDTNSDVATLLTEIKNLSNRIEDNTSVYNALHEAKVNFYKYQQSNDESLADHM